MSVKSLLRTYLRQQKQIAMPDLVVKDIHLIEVFTGGKPVKKIAPPVVKAQTTTEPQPSVAPVIKQPQAISGLGKLSSLRKVDQLQVVPRAKKPVVTAPVVNVPVKAVESCREAMKQLYLEGCSGCQLSKSRKKTVFGAGNVDSSILIIGSAPGEEEDARGMPFIGPGGQLLTQMLSAIKIDKAKDTFTTNILKCRTPSDRTPQSGEIQACLPTLKKQIAIMKPKAILLLGEIAANALLGKTDTIEKMRAQVFDYEGIPCMVIYHPEALLANTKLKRPAWDDLQKFKELLEKNNIHGSL